MNAPDKPANMPADMAENRKRAALLGHDIRSSVADILGGLELADLSAIDDETRRQLDRVRSASQQLVRLSDEILALVTGDATLVSAGRAPFKLPHFLNGLKPRWEAQAGSRGLSFTLELDDAPDTISNNQGDLERVLVNLIGNSVKHTKTGGVTLHVGMGQQEMLQFSICDTGPGFSEAALGQLFEEGGRPVESETPGSGLGLHIVRGLVKRAGGRLQVRNHSEGGAEVTVSFPRPAWAPGVATPDSAHSLPDLTGFHVLVADDNATNQLLIQQMLDSLGAQSHVASDGYGALELVERKEFDLALIDIEMPRLSGLDLIRTIRAREQISVSQEPLSVLAVTAYVLAANRDQIYEAGADGILAKPILSLEALGEAIAAVLDKRRPVDEPETETGFPVDVLQLDRLLALAGDDDGCELLTRLTMDFTSVRDGIREGIKTRNFAQIRARTHVLISLAGAVGATALQHGAEAMNDASHRKTEGLADLNGDLVLTQIDAVLDHLSTEYTNRFGPGAR